MADARRKRAVVRAGKKLRGETRMRVGSTSGWATSEVAILPVTPSCLQTLDLLTVEADDYETLPGVLAQVRRLTPAGDTVYCKME